MAGIGGLGGVLAKSLGEVLTAAHAGPHADRCWRVADVADRYGLRRALSGVWRGSVDVVSGAKIGLLEDEADFALRGRLPLRWGRFYSSALRTAGLLGSGWRTPWEVSLHLADDRLTYTDEFGRALTVPFPTPGSQVIVPAERLHVARLSDGRIVVADLTPTYRVFGDFDENGVARLKYIEDLHRQRIGCIWDADGRLLRMRGTCGHELRLHYDASNGSRLRAIECVDGAPTGILSQYGYTPNGELAEVRNRLGDVVRRFAYRDGRMVEEANAHGMATRYVWRTIGGSERVVERITSEGARERLAYGIDARTTEVTDVFGAAAVWQYDERGYVASFADFDGRRYRFQNDDYGAPVVLWLPGERVVRLAYDGLGRVVQEVDPLGRTRETQYAFASLEPSMISMGDGRTWRWRRNDYLQPFLLVPPSEGSTTRIDYGAEGWPAQRIDAEGRVTAFEHNAWGQVTRRTDPGERVTQYEYDDNGHLVGVTDATGAVTRIECDVLGQPLVVTRPDGRHERYIWNAAGRLASFVSANGQARRWHWDRRGNLAREIDEEGRATAYHYDAHGRPIRIESDNGAVRTLEWNALDCASVTDADGVRRAFDYTDTGQIGCVTTRSGGEERKEYFAYDAAGRVIQRETLHNHYVYRYSGQGLLETITRTPTKDGELLGIVADEIRFEYDAGGRLIAECGAHGELRHAYNPTGLLATTTLPQGPVVGLPRYEDGMVGRIDFDERQIATFWYDGERRQIALKQGALTTHIGYTELGWPQSWRVIPEHMATDGGTLSESDMQLWREASYGPSGTLASVAGPVFGQTTCDYDKRGYLLRRVSDESGVEYFMWDGAGNLLDAAPDGNWLPAVHAHHRMPACRGHHYEYDAWGQVVKRDGRDRAFTLEWDAEGRVVAVRGNEHVTRYRYDALGRRIEKVVEKTTSHRPLEPVLIEAECTRYLWQGNRLLQEQRLGTVRTYLYHPTPDESIGYAPLAFVEQRVLEDGALGEAQVYHYHTDVVGTAIALTDDAGELVWRARYLAWGKHAESGWGGKPTAQPLRFAGQYFDEETALHHHGARLYDPDAGRYLSPDRTGLSGTSPYRYAPNPFTWCNPLGRAVPERFARVRARVSGMGLDLAPDLAQQCSIGTEQFDDVMRWTPFEFAVEPGIKIEPVALAMS